MRNCLRCEVMASSLPLRFPCRRATTTDLDVRMCCAFFLLERFPRHRRGFIGHVLSVTLKAAQCEIAKDSGTNTSPTTLGKSWLFKRLPQVVSMLFPYGSVANSLRLWMGCILPLTQKYRCLIEGVVTHGDATAQTNTSQRWVGAGQDDGTTDGR